MSDFDSLINSLLAQAPHLSRTEVDGLIRQKKDKIGAGYLTDEGAVFLIASDLGVTLGAPVGSDMPLKKLPAGANAATVKAKVLCVSPIRNLTRKDGSPLLLRTMAVYDADATRNVKMWDDKANLPALSKINPGDLIRVSGVYTKTDLNGEVAIHMGSDSSIEVLHEESGIPSIAAITRDVGAVTEPVRDIAVEGTIDGQLTTINFTSNQGQPRKALKMKLKGENGSSLSVILWGKDESDVPRSVPVNSKARLIGVSAKAGRQGSAMEIHGNEGTVLELEGSQEAGPLLVRIISSGTDGSGNNVILAVNGRRDMLILKDTARQTLEFGPGDVLECMPSQSFGNSIVLDDTSYVNRKDDNPEIPRDTDLRTEVANVQQGGIYCIDVIVLKGTELRDITTRAGENIKLGETFVEDPTGQIWVKGWRNQSGLLAGLMPGQILSIAGVEARSGLEGRTELFLTVYSSVREKK